MKNIKIRFACFGTKIQSFELPENSSVNDLKNKLLIKTGNGNFYCRDKKLDLDSVLTDGDNIVFASSISGEVTVRRNGEIWRVYLSDPDSFPSDFHAHNVTSGEILDLYTGYLYTSKNKEKINKLNKRDYKAILVELGCRKERIFQNKAINVLKRINL